MKRLALTLFLFASFGLMAGCDSDSGMDEPEPDDPAVVTTTIENTGSASYPGDPDKLVLRAIGGGEQTVNFPESGSTVEVNLRSVPGDYQIGILAYDSETGEASFGAVTDTTVTVTAGEIVDVDLSSRIESWTNFGVKEIRNGNWEVGDEIQLYVGGEPSSVLYSPIWDDYGGNDNSKLYYDSQSFSDVANAQFSHSEFNLSYPDDPDEYVSYTQGLTLKEEVTNSFVGRIQVDVEEWGGAQHITRPHPSNPPQDVLEQVTGGTSITFIRGN